MDELKSTLSDVSSVSGDMADEVIDGLDVCRDDLCDGVVGVRLDVQGPQLLGQDVLMHDNKRAVVAVI